MAHPRPPRPRSCCRPVPALVLVFTLALVVLVALASAFFWVRSTSLPAVRGAVRIPAAANASEPPPPADPWQEQVAQWVNGEPTSHFQDNLRADMAYITTWVSGGWTNDFMTYINMLYLSLLTRRIPVLPPFAPSHVPYAAGFLHFGDVFDVPRLARAIGAPLLEWRDVKSEGSDAVDNLSCWSIWALVGDSGKARHSLIPAHLKLDVSYTPLPTNAERMRTTPNGFWLPFSTLAALPAPTTPRLACFDFMYYVGAAHHDEWWAPWSPAWRIVGTHARWVPRLERLAARLVHRALADVAEAGPEAGSDLGSDPDSEADTNSDSAPPSFPPYISVHVRRGDFTAACGVSGTPATCFPPLAAYVRRVAQVRAELLASRALALSAAHVLVTSDEADAAWWSAVAAQGWRRTDSDIRHGEGREGHDQTWLGALVDAVVQSRAVGFVGTDRSTMSLVAKRRVEDWQGGVTYMVPMGAENADDD